MPTTFAVSRQLVLLTVERRKAWRLLQSKAGITNNDYLAQKVLLARVGAGEVTRDQLWKEGAKLLADERAKKK